MPLKFGFAVVVLALALIVPVALIAAHLELDPLALFAATVGLGGGTRLHAWVARARRHPPTHEAPDGVASD
jgi:hypothetical protein